jgi:hypothetical protein
VTEQSNNQTYTFNLSIERLFPLRSPTPIAPDQVIAGVQIEPVADLDTFQFNASVGDEFRIILTSVTEQANNQTFTYSVSLTCVSGACPDPPPVCLVNPSYAGNTMTLDFTVGTPEPAQWHLAMLAIGNTYTLWKLEVPVLEPPVSASLPIPGFPGLGTIAFLSTFTDPSGLVCTDLKTVDTGPMSPGMTPTLLRQYFPLIR